MLYHHMVICWFAVPMVGCVDCASCISMQTIKLLLHVGCLEVGSGSHISWCYTHFRNIEVVHVRFRENPVRPRVGGHRSQPFAKYCGCTLHSGCGQ